jgi:6-phosphogluconolactonase
MKNLIPVMVLAMVSVMSSCKKENAIFLASGYSAEGKQDVMLCRLNDDGSIETLSGIDVGDNPSFFDYGNDGLIYCANEVDTFNFKAGGGITTLLFDAKENKVTKISSINQGGGGPCHIVLSNDRKYLITANYGSGSVSVVKLDSAGIPAEVTDVIYYGNRSHPHMTLYNPRLNLYYISDLGLDRIHQLRLDTAIGRLIDADVAYIRSAPGSGPRHMAIDKPGANLYVINELSSKIYQFDILSDSAKMQQTVSTLPGDYTGESFCADIHLSANGKKLYGSNRGHNSIVTFKVGLGGRLSDPTFQDCGGNWPRNFAVSPAGKYFVIANQRSNEISVLSADKKTEGKAVSKLPFNAPACVRFLR